MNFNFALVVTIAVCGRLLAVAVTRVSVAAVGIAMVGAVVVTAGVGIGVGVGVGVGVDVTACASMNTLLRVFCVLNKMGGVVGTVSVNTYGS